MIKFFRKIRQRLLTENKLSKYLLYAIGEIILVVIGILLALQINNWNENNKYRKAETQTLINLKTEFKKNHEGLLEIIKYKIRHENQSRNYIEMITNDTVPLFSKIQAKIPTLNTSRWNAKYPVLNSLLSSGDIKRIKNDSLKLMLMNWNMEIEKFHDMDNRHLDVTIERYKYIDNHIYGQIVKSAKHDSIWPGGYYPNNISDKLYDQKATIINDVAFYNHTKLIITQSFIMIKMAKQNIKYSEKIMNELDSELKKRTK